MRQVETNTTTQLLDDLGLGRTTHTGYGKTGIDRRTNTGIKQIGFQEDLPIGNGNDVGRHEGRHVTRLGFDDRQCGEGTGLAFYRPIGFTFDVLNINSRGTFQQTGVQIENVTRIGFTTRRTT